MLNDPWIVDASQEGSNLLTEIRSFADSVIVVESTSDLVALLGNGTLTGGQLVIPEQEWGSLSSALGSQSRSLLAQHIEGGLGTSCCCAFISCPDHANYWMVYVDNFL